MEKLREAAAELATQAQAFVASSITKEGELSDEAVRLAKCDEDLKKRESVVSSAEAIEKILAGQEERNEKLSNLQSSVSRDFEDNTRQRKVFAEEKEKWQRQKSADQRGIDNERTQIREQNAALAKEKAEYKEKVLKKLKAGAI